MFSDSRRSVEGTVTVRQRETGAAAAFDSRYNFKSIANFIATGRTKTGDHFTKIAVQFSDDLLFESVRVVDQIKSDVSRILHDSSRAVSIFALADSSFSPCCPDEVAARHYGADAIVHLGFACFSQTNSLPVLHDMPTAEPSIDTLASCVTQQWQSCHQVVVVVHPGLRGVATTLTAALQGSTATPPVSESGSYALLRLRDDKTLVVADAVAFPPSDATRATLQSEQPNEWCINGATFPVEPKQRIVFFGPHGAPQLHQLALVALYNESQGGADAASGGLELVSPEITAEVAVVPELDAASDDVSTGIRVVRQRIRQRMFNIEQVKAATAIGIVVTNTGMKDAKATADLLRTACIRGGRRAYIIFLGHLNPHKLANFADSIDCFIVVSCPNSRIAHFANKSDGIFKPLVSPAEALIALGHSDFMSIRGFSTNFELALSAETSVNAPKEEDGDKEADEDESRVKAAESRSLVTGRPMNVAVAGQSAVQRLNERSYVGLDPRIGQTPVQTTLVDGRAGIAKGYSTEKESQS